MSIVYFIFLNANGPAELVFEPLCQVEGVNCQGAFRISGLTEVVCEPLSASQHEVILDGYGEYGLDVNWKIRGTYDKGVPGISVAERLFRCAAVLVNAHPHQSLSLMEDGESFLLFNTRERLILAPFYVETIAGITTLFKKPFTVEEISY